MNEKQQATENLSSVVATHSCLVEETHQGQATKILLNGEIVTVTQQAYGLPYLEPGFEVMADQLADGRIIVHTALLKNSNIYSLPFSINEGVARIVLPEHIQGFEISLGAHQVAFDRNGHLQVKGKNIQIKSEESLILRGDAIHIN